MEQGTDEWHQARLGKVTASRVADVMAKTKTGYGASRANYMADLLVERLSGRQGDHYQNAAMQWGTEQEPNARAAYEVETGSIVMETGFVPHSIIGMSGSSPDGLIGDDGLVEIKCPNTSTHIDTLLGQEAPSKYILQMQWQMACTDRKWCDFVSYDPRLPENMQLYIQRVIRDDKLIKEIEQEVIKFLGELDGKLMQLRLKYEV
jgi:putative phage-type endonuclease